MQSPVILYNFPAILATLITALLLTSVSALDLGEIKCFEYDPYTEISKADIEQLISDLRAGTTKNAPNPLPLTPTNRFWSITSGRARLGVGDQLQRLYSMSATHEDLANALEQMQNHCCKDSYSCNPITTIMGLMIPIELSYVADPSYPGVIEPPKCFDYSDLEINRADLKNIISQLRSDTVPGTPSPLYLKHRDHDPWQKDISQWSATVHLENRYLDEWDTYVHFETIARALEQVQEACCANSPTCPRIHAQIQGINGLRVVLEVRYGWHPPPMEVS